MWNRKPESHLRSIPTIVLIDRTPLKSSRESDFLVTVWRYKADVFLEIDPVPHKNPPVSRRTPSFRKWLYPVLGLALAASIALLIQKRRPSVLLPYPVMEEANEALSIQWDTEWVPLSRLPDNSENHPGFALAQKHCVACHLLPTPDQLPRGAWPFAMTWMANYLGYPNYYGPFRAIVTGSLIPEEPTVTKEEFQQLSEYFIAYAEDDETYLPPQTDQKPKLTRFAPEVPLNGVSTGELITFARFLPASQKFYIGRASEAALQVFDESGAPLQSVELGSEPVDMRVSPQRLDVALLGDFLVDKVEGRVVSITANESGDVIERTLIEKFPRLTQATFEDFDQDGKEDLLALGFGSGDSHGRVSIFWDIDGASEEQVLAPYAGAINAIVHDFDADGIRDILLLVAQNRQEVSVFLNDGARGFEQRILIKEFAGFGYNHVSVADFNSDGRMDLILANGNNMEIKNAPLKPYHGIRVYENLGDFTFTIRFSYPMYGALKAIAEDFDRDGDLDIAATAFYPDWSDANPETFALLENTGGFEFTPSVLENPNWQRWMTMETADVNGDGYEDIVLGGGYAEHGLHTDLRDEFVRRTASNPSIVVLKNVGETSR